MIVRRYLHGNSHVFTLCFIASQYIDFPNNKPLKSSKMQFFTIYFCMTMTLLSLDVKYERIDEWG